MRRVRHVEKSLRFGAGFRRSRRARHLQELREFGFLIQHGALRGRNAIDHGPIEIRGRVMARTRKSLSNMWDVVLAVLQQGIVLHSD